MLDKDPNNRVSAKKALESPYFLTNELSLSLIQQINSSHLNGLQEGNLDVNPLTVNRIWFDERLSFTQIEEGTHNLPIKSHATFFQTTEDLVNISLELLQKESHDNLSSVSQQNIRVRNFSSISFGGGIKSFFMKGQLSFM